MLSKSRMVGEMEIVWHGILVKEPEVGKNCVPVCVGEIENAF